MVFPERAALAHDLSCIIWKDDIPPPKKIVYLWAESERRPFRGNTWEHDASPSEEKQET